MYYYAHLDLEKEFDRGAGKYKFWIGNIEGHRSGYCYIDTIYGKLVQILH